MIESCLLPANQGAICQTQEYQLQGVNENYVNWFAECVSGLRSGTAWSTLQIKTLS